MLPFYKNKFNYFSILYNNSNINNAESAERAENEHPEDPRKTFSYKQE